MDDESEPTARKPAPSVLWVAIERRCRDPRIGLRPMGLANDRTLGKIKRGEILEGSRGTEVYERIDRVLKWHTGDAETCARTGDSPRPLEELQDNWRTWTLEVATMLTRASAKISSSPDDADRADLIEAEKIARKILEKKERDGQQGGSGSTSGQLST